MNPDDFAKHGKTLYRKNVMGVWEPVQVAEPKPWFSHEQAMKYDVKAWEKQLARMATERSRRAVEEAFTGERWSIGAKLQARPWKWIIFPIVGQATPLRVRIVEQCQYSDSYVLELLWAGEVHMLEVDGLVVVNATQADVWRWADEAFTCG